jgi:hypothetical protein
MTEDELIAKLGLSQQTVMYLTVQKRQLEKLREKAEHRAEVLEELIMDVVADCRDGVSHAVIDLRIGRIMQRLDGDD